MVSTLPANETSTRAGSTPGRSISTRISVGVSTISTGGAHCRSTGRSPTTSSARLPCCKAASTHLSNSRLSRSTDCEIGPDPCGLEEYAGSDMIATFTSGILLGVNCDSSRLWLGRLRENDLQDTVVHCGRNPFVIDLVAENERAQKVADAVF